MKDPKSTQFTKKIFSPEDILPDGVEYTEEQGIRMRKGTIAACLKNADIVASQTASEEEKAAALNAIKDAAPSLVALGMHKHTVWKNPKIQALIDEAAKDLG